MLRSRRASLQESIDEVIDEHHELGGAIDEEEKEILHNAISFAGLHVRDAMTPRSDIIHVSETVSLEKLRMTVIEKAHTRFPVCRASLDEVRGFIHIKDLVPYLAGEKPFKIEEIIRQVLFVPPSMKLSDLLLHMRASRTHMAIVVDEYGGTMGLATMEDLMEEIVGEIRDEHDDESESPFFREVSTGVFEASGRLSIDELEQQLGEKIDGRGEDENFDTLGGLLFAILGRVPVNGEVIRVSDLLEFEILDADPRRIKRVLIRVKDDDRARKKVGAG
jgi:CBS domain containing-hemolysin-like protein